MSEKLHFQRVSIKWNFWCLKMYKEVIFEQVILPQNKTTWWIFGSLKIICVNYGQVFLPKSLRTSEKKHHNKIIHPLIHSGSKSSRKIKIIQKAGYTSHHRIFFRFSKKIMMMCKFNFKETIHFVTIFIAESLFSYKLNVGT